MLIIFNKLDLIFKTIASCVAFSSIREALSILSNLISEFYVLSVCK